jgi:hypothetical protein
MERTNAIGAQARFAATRAVRFLAIAVLVAVVGLGAAKMVTSAAKGAEESVELNFTCEPIDTVIGKWTAVGVTVLGDQRFGPVDATGMPELRHLALVDEGMWVGTYDRVAVLTGGALRDTTVFVFGLGPCFIAAFQQLPQRHVPVPIPVPAPVRPSPPSEACTLT